LFHIFKKKTTNDTGDILRQIQADMHSHILPGIDDGSPDVETSLVLIEALVKKGYKKFICTPHIFKELYPNTRETITGAYEKLLPFVKEKFPNVEMGYAAEYYMDEYFDQLLADNEKLLTVHENWVLVEHSFMQAPFDLKEKLFNLQMAGYTPILAHPERYEFYTKNIKAYDELYDIGCIFQVNLLSLIGYYGKTAQELAKHLISKKYIKLIGTDMHHFKHMEAMQSINTNKYITELLQQGNLLNTTL
jgi:protein-tyrosine phosphatase